MDRVQRELAAERAPLLAQLRPGTETESHHARPRLGHANPRRRVRGTRGQEDLRLVRRGHRLPLGLGGMGREPGEPDAWREWWQNPDAEHTYFMGKDNIVFHTVIWPSILLGYGKGGEIGAGLAPLKLPDNVASSEFLTMEGKRFSVEPRRRHPSARLPQPVRPGLVAVLPLDCRPGDAGHGFHVGRVHPTEQRRARRDVGQSRQPDAAEHLQNFGQVPKPAPLAAEDEQLLAEIDVGFDSVGALIEAARFKSALQEAMRLAALVNQYVAAQAPWTMLESDRERAGTILFVALRAIDSLKIFLTPFLPFSCQRLHEFLGYDGVIAGPLSFAHDRRGRAGARRAHGRLRGVGRHLGPERASARPAAARAQSAASRSSIPTRWSRRSSSVWRMRRAYRSATRATPTTSA